MSMDKLEKNENVTTAVLEKICSVLNCVILVTTWKSSLNLRMQKVDICLILLER